MSDTAWEFQARQFANCNCAYGCPCQFNALPTYNTCQAVVGFHIEKGHHGKTRLDGLNIAGIFRWPGPIHEGKGEAALAIETLLADGGAAENDLLLAELSEVLQRDKLRRYLTKDQARRFVEGIATLARLGGNVMNRPM